MSKLFATKTGNPGHTDDWICPGCYADLGNIGPGGHTCPNCGRLILCYVHIGPMCVAELIETSPTQETTDD